MKNKITIEDVKNTIAFDGSLGVSLKGIVECKYRMALQEGKTEQEAVEISIDELTNRLLKFGEKS